MSEPNPRRLYELGAVELPPFTPTIVYWVRRTIDQLPDRRVLTDVFYEQLFEIAPETRGMFPADITPQKDRLLGALLAAANGLDKPEAVEPHLRRWGVIHRRKHGVTNAQYVYVGQALVRTITRVLSNSDSLMHSSWVAVYQWMAAVMIEGADQAEVIDQDPSRLLMQTAQPALQEPEPTRSEYATVTALKPREARGGGRRRASGG